VESDVRYYRRRANEEIMAAGRAVTEAARLRRMQLADIFLERVKSLEADCVVAERERSAFRWQERSAIHA